MKLLPSLTSLSLGLCLSIATGFAESATPVIGQEVAIPRHLADGDEYRISLPDLVEHGKKLFSAVWTIQEGGGRPLTKGTGAPLKDPTSPLVFPRNFNRISAPDSNSCAGCHNAPFGIAGGGGDFVANVFVLGQRFDFATFNADDQIPTRGALDEGGMLTTQQTIANERNTLGMFGSGYIEMLARQMTADLQAIRDATSVGASSPLQSKEVSFGNIIHRADGTWDVSQVEGIPATSLVTPDAAHPPTLIIRPFHQAGRVISLREFTNNAFNHHHGIQSTERFGVGTDPDGDGVTNEMTRADVTAASVFQATLAVPGRVIPRDPTIEAAVRIGEKRFSSIGCVQCHIPSLTLDAGGGIFSEPNPYNEAGNLRVGDAPTLKVDLSDPRLPQPRLAPEKKSGVIKVDAFTDLKLHDICDGPNDPNAEPLDMQKPATSPAFFAGNRKFVTRKLWGAANEPPFFHHGRFTTMRQAVLAHSGEARTAREAFEALPAYERDSIIEFLKTLQVLPPGTNHRIIDERGNPRPWHPED
jgi:cytochrome c peroxidase